MAVLIVASAGLVLSAIVLLVVGLTREGTDLIFWSIGASVAAGVLLVLGILQQRKAARPQQAARPAAPARSATSSSVSVTKVDKAADKAAADKAGAASADGDLQVSVVPGRPRFHTADCRFLAGRTDVTTVARSAAEGDGYTACGVCRPLDASGSDAGTDSGSSSELVDVSAGDDDAVTVSDEGRARTRVAAASATRTRTAASTSRSTTGTRTPAKATSTRTSAAKAAPARAAAKATTTSRTAAKAAPARAASTTRATASKAAPAKTAAKAAPAKASPSKASKATPAGSVVVIPDRDKFHGGDCRFVRGVAGTVTVSKVTAKRQGYVACGVCKP